MSSTPAQIISVIRFNLSELKARNGHHEFEQLCRHLAQLRIYSNILPATGPVGTGGDAGRDFETFSTSLNWPTKLNWTFAGRSSGERKVAFACSMEGKIEPKIRSDVNSILATGSVDEIIHFCESNLPVAKRHALQRWAEAERGVTLQIFDGQAIAEFLSARDTFWIAQEFLRIPAELFPPLPEKSSWYADAIDRWQQRNPIIVNRSDFAEIKHALRHATFDADARPWLSFWIQRMECFVSDGVPRELHRAALYELVVAYLRGKNELASQAERVRDFYSDFEDWPGTADLQDAATLAAYMFGALGLGHAALDPKELIGWRSRIVDCLEQHLATASGAGRRSALLQVRGYICAVPLQVGGGPQFDESFDWWARMLDEAEQTPLFPIESFADYLAKITPGWGDHPRFAPLADRVDALVAKRAGQAVAAEKIFDRAVAFYDQDEILLAVGELHRALAKWFSGDAMPRFQRAMLLLSNWYLELHLAYAAKYYALSACLNARYGGSDEVSQTLPTMLFAAANADDAAGNSLSFLQLLIIAIDAHCRLDQDPLDLSIHPDLRTNIEQVAALRGFASRAGPELLTTVDEVLKVWPEALRRPIVAASEDPMGFWATKNWDDTWLDVEQSFLGRPFGDVGPRRTIVWRALGVQWSVIFENDYRSTLLGEQFVAELQILLACFAEIDLSLLPTKLHLFVSIDENSQHFEISERKTIDGEREIGLEVVVPGVRTTQEPSYGSHEVLTAIAMILRQCSVLPDEDLLRAMEPGMLAAAERIFVGRTYSDLYGEFVPAEFFQAERRRNTPEFLTERVFHESEHLALTWVDRPGPTYSAEVARESVLGRYSRGQKCVGITMKRLTNTSSTRSELERLRAMGMKDWEILSIVANLAINFRMPINRDDEITPEHMQRFRAALEVEEVPSTALATELFTKELFETGRLTFLAAFLSGWGLSLKDGPTDWQALEQFLIRRYNLRTDDEDHVDLFCWADSIAPPEVESNT